MSEEPLTDDEIERIRLSAEQQGLARPEDALRLVGDLRTARFIANNETEWTQQLGQSVGSLQDELAAASAEIEALRAAAEAERTRTSQWRQASIRSEERVAELEGEWDDDHAVLRRSGRGGGRRVASQARLRKRAQARRTRRCHVLGGPMPDGTGPPRRSNRLRRRAAGRSAQSGRDGHARPVPVPCGR